MNFMQEAYTRTRFQSQNYGQFWSAVMISERSQLKLGDLEILYPSFRRALQRTLSLILDGAGENATGKISALEIVPMDEVPSGIKLSYTFSEEGLMICDIWTPTQPSLFGV
jgi:hypothetical protein